MRLSVDVPAPIVRGCGEMGRFIIGLLITLLGIHFDAAKYHHALVEQRNAVSEACKIQQERLKCSRSAEESGLQQGLSAVAKRK